MKIPYAQPRIALLAFLALSISSWVDAKSKRPPSTTAHSIVSPEYQRERLPNGEWKAESIAFAKGKLLDPTARDDSLSTMSFQEMAELLAEALQNENYFPTQRPESTDLLIVVSWGKTIPYNDGYRSMSVDGMSNALATISSIQNNISSRALASGGTESASAAESSQLSAADAEFDSMLMMQDMSDRARLRANAYNARLLGYAPSIKQGYADSLGFGPKQAILDDLLDEIETPRYFVILQAYDFQRLWKKKEKDLLWISRFSIRAKGRSFNEELENMALAASSTFGNESGKLKRRLRPGKIKMGELEVIDVLENGVDDSEDN